MFESKFQVQPRTKSLMYFWRGAAAQAGMKFNTFSPPTFPRLSENGASGRGPETPPSQRWDRTKPSLQGMTRKRHRRSRVLL